MLEDKKGLAEKLIELNKKQIDVFFDSLKKSVTRHIEQIIILPLHGNEFIISSVSQALELLESYDESSTKESVSRYEILVRFNTGDEINAKFKDKIEALKFLRNYA